jgi:hypothetical protein
MRRRPLHILAFGCVIAFATNLAGAADPLSSWNEGKTKESTIKFVETVTRKGSPEFVSPAERIAAFDNDGTLWSEQPLYFQFFLALAGGEKSIVEISIVEIIEATHSGMTTEEFEQIVKDWNSSAVHPSANDISPSANGRRIANRRLARSIKLDEAVAKGWTIVDMKDDWKTIYPTRKTDMT